MINKRSSWNKNEIKDHFKYFFCIFIKVFNITFNQFNAFNAKNLADLKHLNGSVCIKYK